MKRVLSAVHRGIVAVFSLPIRFYRRFLSPLKPVPCCRFTPTCSQYALEALEEWGVVCGTALALWRILRCNPFCRGGYDPVPLGPWHKSEDADAERKPASEPVRPQEKNDSEE